MKIEPPKNHKAADYTRAATKGAIGAIPLAGSILAEVADIILPDPSSEDRKRWEGQITEGHNSLSEQFNSSQVSDATEIVISGAAAIIAKSMIESCSDGLAHAWVSIEEIITNIDGLERQQALDGLGDLESMGLIESMGFIGGANRYCLTGSGYEALDLEVMGWSPRKDSKALVGLLNNAGDGVDVSDLFQNSGWPKRRFNPALRIVLGFISHDCISRERCTDFVTNWFLPNNAELASLRRFASQ